jgi:hypothetical protein
VWVEQEQCKQFVANLLTAFPADKLKALSDPEASVGMEVEIGADMEPSDGGPRPPPPGSAGVGPAGVGRRLPHPANNNNKGCVSIAARITSYHRPLKWPVKIAC